MQTPHPIPVSIEKCRLNKTSALFDPSLSFKDWLAAGSQLAAVNHATLFWVGDWATFGRTAFGQRAADAMRESHILGIDPQQLLLPGLIAASIEPEQRRESLSFGHHCEVAEMQKRDQSRWLDLAEKAGWSVSEFRAQIRRSQGTQNAHASDGPVIKTIGNKLDDVKTFIVSQPAEFWDEERKRIWRDRIKPIVEFYETKLAAACVLAVLVFGSGCSYSDGTRTGTVTKFSNKGLFCKSWEAEMVLGGVRRISDS